MKVIIKLITEFPKVKSDAYIQQMAEWFFVEWGKYDAAQTQGNLQSEIYQSIARGEKVLVAADEYEKLIGTVTLRKEHMDNQFPEFKCWLSLIYVDEAARKGNVSTCLIHSLISEAIDGGNEKIYVYSHNLQIENYYRNMGWELIKPFMGTHYSYHDKPIILMEGKTQKILSIVQTKFDGLADEKPALSLSR
jgi:N-acetylglutamate synthase-like GNAT family acetyltransferase